MVDNFGEGAGRYWEVPLQKTRINGQALGPTSTTNTAIFATADNLLSVPLETLRGIANGIPYAFIIKGPLPYSVNDEVKEGQSSLIFPCNADFTLDFTFASAPDQAFAVEMQDIIAGEIAPESYRDRYRYPEDAIKFKEHSQETMCQSLVIAEWDCLDMADAALKCWVLGTAFLKK